MKRLFKLIASIMKKEGKKPELSNIVIGFYGDESPAEYLDMQMMADKIIRLDRLARR